MSLPEPEVDFVKSFYQMFSARALRNELREAFTKSTLSQKYQALTDTCQPAILIRQNIPSLQEMQSYC